MTVAILSLACLPSLPVTKQGVHQWIARNNIPTAIVAGKKVVNLSDLPDDIRTAYLARELDRTGLAPGAYDDAAHEAFLKMLPNLRNEAERRAQVVRTVLSLGPDASWEDRMAVLATKVRNPPHVVSVKRWVAKVDGVDPINYAPALVRTCGGGAIPKPVSDEAWNFFLKLITRAGPGFPIKQAWRDVRNVAAKNNWDWPSYDAVHERWSRLPEAQRRQARLGTSEAVKTLAIPYQRDKTSIRSLEWVSLDGRTQDFWTDLGDGKPVRRSFIALVDVASNFILGYRIATAENAADTVSLIKEVCKKYGRFDRLYPDNGRAFASHLVAGGDLKKFRNSNSKAIAPPGICYHLGIEITWALPGHGQSKIAERTFATLSRTLEDRPEFDGAHAGHKPGASPNRKVKPIPIEVAKSVIEREVNRYNREIESRGQGMHGRTYEQAFKDGLKGRDFKALTEPQLYRSGLIYTPASVTKFGQVTIDGWTYGGPETQEELLPYYEKGQILIGRDPDDFEAPAVAYDPDLEWICGDIMPMKAGAYGDAAGAREAGRLKSDARKKVAKAREANEAMEDHEFQRLLAQIEAPPSVLDDAPKQVVKGHFSAPLKGKKSSAKSGEVSAITPEMQRIFDLAVMPQKAGGGV